MTKQTITTEIDIPDGYEFVRIGLPELGEEYLFGGNFSKCTVPFYGKSGWMYVIIRPIWQWPEWLTAEWLVIDGHNIAWATNAEPFTDKQSEYCWCFPGKPWPLDDRFLDFTPPPCTDWKQSKRRNPRSEK